MKNTSLQGALGEIAVVKDLMSRGYEVFQQMGEGSKVDLIALDKNYSPIKIQAKSTYLKEDQTFSLSVRSNGGKRNDVNRDSSLYSEEQVDVFALYVRDLDEVYYIPSSVALQYKTGMVLRLNEAKNGQTKGINLARDYKDLRV